MNGLVLTGQYDSPFVRRAAVALHLHRLAFRRQVLSTFADFDALRQANPVAKVPYLTLKDGTVLPDSRAIIEWADLQVGAERRLLPRGREVDVLQVEAVAIALAEKTYERGIEVNRRAPGTQDSAWMERLETQIAGALDWLEQRAPLLNADDLTRAELAVTVALTFLFHKQPQLFTRGEYHELYAWRERAESLPVFRSCAYSEAEARATGWRPESEIS